jgi:hypothetical protein
VRTAAVFDIRCEIAPARQACIDAHPTIAKICKAPDGAEMLWVDARPADCG